ncbi:MAG: hypothetical protein K0S11_1107 [Gammaproteobacteria bacterium]|jgi:hypothetical protein|nr:hypothetical protein [Gammaproteobacteria bacterium]
MSVKPVKIELAFTNVSTNYDCSIDLDNSDGTVVWSMGDNASGANSKGMQWSVDSGSLPLSKVQISGSKLTFKTEPASGGSDKLVSFNLDAYIVPKDASTTSFYGTATLNDECQITVDIDGIENPTWTTGSISGNW